MDIISSNFIIFILIFLVFWHLSKNLNLRILLISISSLVYYALNDFQHLWLLVATILVSYLGGLLYARHHSRKVIYASLVLQLALLLYFKINNTNPLPLGVSFFIFQAMAYGFDIIAGLTPIRSLSLYSAFISFFPQLIAGPICRVRELVPQLSKDKTQIDYQLAFTYLIKGYFLKLVLADSLAHPIDSLLSDNFWHINSWQMWLIFIGYGWQLYFDFWGYTNIAYGLAQLIGINLPQNFIGPYFSQSISEFWRRWHITLSHWFKDYVYKPLGGKSNFPFALLLTFIISGLWHGAGYNFLLWGLFHGLLVSIEKFLRIDQAKASSKIVQAIFNLRTYLLISFGWMFFRITDFNQIIYLMNRMVFLNFKTFETPHITTILVLCLISITWEFLDHFYSAITKHWMVLGFLLFLIINFASGGEAFIYYRF